MADEVSEEARVAKPAVSNLQLAFVFVPLQAVPQLYLQTVRVQWLFQEVVGTKLGGLHGLFDGALPGQNNEDRGVSRVTQLLQQLHAPHCRHTEIGDYHQGIESGHLLQRLPTVGSRFSLVAPVLEECGESLSLRNFVLYNQDPGASTHRLIPFSNRMQ